MKTTYLWTFNIYSNQYIRLNIEGLMVVKWYKDSTLSHRYFFSKADLADMFPPSSIEYSGGMDEQEFFEKEHEFWLD